MSLEDLNPFAVGDIVTRDGSDRWRVVGVIADDFIQVECARASDRGWCEIGDADCVMVIRCKTAQL